MKLLALGATGRTGRWVLEYALGAGHDVVALARTPEKTLARSPKLSVVRGTPENPMTRDEVLTKARDLVTPVLGAQKCTQLLAKIMALEDVADIRAIRPLLQLS